MPPEAIPTHPSASPEHAANLASAYRLLDRVSAEERAASAPWSRGPTGAFPWLAAPGPSAG